MDGFKASARAMKLRPGLKIVMTSADGSIRDKALSAGLGFIEKPFSKTELVELVTDFLAQRVMSGPNPFWESLRISTCEA